MVVNVTCISILVLLNVFSLLSFHPPSSYFTKYQKPLPTSELSLRKQVKRLHE